MITQSKMEDIENRKSKKANTFDPYWLRGGSSSGHVVILVLSMIMTMNLKWCLTPNLIIE